MILNHDIQSGLRDSYFQFEIFMILVLLLILLFDGSESEIDVFESIDKRRQEEEMVCKLPILDSLVIYVPLGKY